MKVKVNDFSGGLRLDKSENLTGFDCARRFENFDCSSGGLSVISSLLEPAVGKDGTTASDLIAGLDVFGGKIFHYHKYNFDLSIEQNYIVIFDKTFTGYYILLGEQVPELKPLGVQFSSAPTAINYRLNGIDVLIMVSETDNMVVWNGQDDPEIILDAPKIKNMDLHYERLFAVTSGGDSTELKFSDDLDPTNWSESLSDAGFISMVDERGKLLKVLSFNDYLFVFRENGITRVYANTSLTTSFYVNHLFTLGGQILADTVAVAGGQIMFLASDGFYLFDGADTKKCLENIFKVIEFNGKESATYFNGCYYLACKIKSEDNQSTDNNAIIAVKMSDFSVSILKYGTPESMAVVKNDNKFRLMILNSSSTEKVLAITGEDTDDNLPVKAVWRTGLSDFNEINKSKVIRRVNMKLLNPNGDKVSLMIFNELGERVEICSYGQEVEELLLFSGKQFGYELSAISKNMTILAVSFEIS